jgi:hypothetical protein
VRINTLVSCREESGGVSRDTPPSPCRPKGEWICDNSECTLEEITASGDLPTMNCPACGCSLRFVTFLEERRLLGCHPRT